MEVFTLITSRSGDIFVLKFTGLLLTSIPEMENPNNLHIITEGNRIYVNGLQASVLYISITFLEDHLGNGNTLRRINHSM
ncbi:MAG TPA: hypothetical protein PK904_05780 [Bacteroidales bacterium]|nr:hypothetical protein [Bacteroidales bacterium]